MKFTIVYSSSEGFYFLHSQSQNTCPNMITSFFNSVNILITFFNWRCVIILTIVNCLHVFGLIFCAIVLCELHVCSVVNILIKYDPDDDLIKYIDMLNWKRVIWRLPRAFVWHICIWSWPILKVKVNVMLKCNSVYQ